MESPALSPEMVAAARRHLTGAYARGVDRLLWDNEKRLMADTDAVDAVLAAVRRGQVVDALDLGAALVLTHAVRLDLDRAEYELFESCHAAGMPDEAIAAVLELPDSTAAARRHRWLRARHKLPRAENVVMSSDAGDRAGQAAVRAGRRAEQARARAAQAARRQRELSRARYSRTAIPREHAEQAAALAGEARVLAGEAYERVALGLLRAADRLDSCAATCLELTDTGSAPQHQLAQEYRQAAQRYRELAATVWPGRCSQPVAGQSTET